MNPRFLSEAINKLRPSCNWSLIPAHHLEVEDDKILNLEWNTTHESAPSASQVFEKATQLETEYQRNSYQRDRATEYPSIQDQLDALYHGGYDAWKAQIEAVKNKYPKPTE